MNDYIRYPFTENDVDFIIFKHHEKYYDLCLNGFKHGTNICEILKTDVDVQTLFNYAIIFANNAPENRDYSFYNAKR